MDGGRHNNTARLELLDGVAFQDGTESLLPKSKKARAVLVYLATAPGGTAKRLRLAELLWSDSPISAAQTSLRKALQNLRDAAGDAAARFYTFGKEDLQFHLDQVEIDAFTPDGAPRHQSGQRFAIDLDPVDPLYDTWLQETRREQVAAELKAANGRLKAAEKVGAAEDAEAAAREILALDMSQEPALIVSLNAHLSAGRHSEARELYNEHVRCMDQLEAPVRPDISRLVGLKSAPTPPASTRPSVTVRGPAMPDAVIEAEDAALEFTDLVELRLSEMPEIILHQGDMATAHYALDFSVKRRGNTAILKIELTDTEPAHSLWRTRLTFDVGMDTERIKAAADRNAASLLSRIEKHALTLARARPDADKSGHEHYLVAKYKFFAADQTGYMDRVVSHLEQAIALEPDFGPAYDHLVQHHNTGSFMSRPGTDLTEPRRIALDYAERLLKLDATSPNAQIAMAWCQLWRQNHAAAQRCIDQAIERMPHEPHRLNSIGTALVYLGDLEQGERFYDHAQDRMIHDLDYQRSDYGELFYLKRDFETALTWLDMGVERSPYRTLFWRIAANAQLGRLTAARQDIDAFADDVGKRWAGANPFEIMAGMRWYIGLLPLRRKVDRDCMFEGLSKAGLSFD